MNKAVIFDLDGTLIDSKLDLAYAVNAALRFMDREELPHERINSYVGDGAPVLMRRAMGAAATQPEVDRALEFFLTYYRQHQLDYTKLYPGVREGLEGLQKAGVRLSVLTNKPVRISNEILSGLGVRDRFDYVYGGNSFDFKKPHPIGIETILRDTGTERANATMVGDSGVDVQTARNAGVSACGVTYGFQPGTLVAHPPDFLIDNMTELIGKIV